VTPCSTPPGPPARAFVLDFCVPRKREGGRGREGGREREREREEERERERERETASFRGHSEMEDSARACARQGGPAGGRGPGWIQDGRGTEGGRGNRERAREGAREDAREGGDLGDDNLMTFMIPAADAADEPPEVPASAATAPPTSALRALPTDDATVKARFAPTTEKTRLEAATAAASAS